MMSKRVFISGLAVLCAVHCFAAVPEQAAVVRNLAAEGQGTWLWFSQPQNDWSGYPIGPVTFWGWGNYGVDYGSGITYEYDFLADAKWADFNGDGIDDKVLVAPIVWGQDNLALGWITGELASLQIAVTYTLDNGNGTVDYITPTQPFAPDGDNCLEWQTWHWGVTDPQTGAYTPANTPTGLAEITPVFGDINGDGLDDNVVIVRQNYTVNPDAGMNWNAYISNGNAGIPKWTAGGTYPTTGWLLFGQEKQTPMVGDINGDGYDDRLIWEFTTASIGDPAVDTTFMWVAVDYSDNVPGDSVYFGDGFIDEYGLLPVGPTAEINTADYDLRVTDINGDGMEDLAMAVAGNPNNYENTYYLYGWFTRVERLTGYAADGSDLPATQAWFGVADVKGNAGFSSFEEDVEYAALNYDATPVAGKVENVVIYRPDSDWFVYDPNWFSGVIAQQAMYGWTGTTADLADFNGDGVVDKVATQVGAGGLQTVVAYSDPDGGFTNGNLDAIQTNWDWLNANNLSPMYGDVDGDGIADAGMTTDGETVFGVGVGDPTHLVWAAWMSQGNPGVSTDFGSAANHTGWNTYGVAGGVHIPLMGDINGDGVDDRVLYDPVTFNLHVDFSNLAGGYGDGVVDQSAGVFGGVAGDQIALVDVNADGYDDVVAVRDMTSEVGGGDWYNLYVYYTNAGTGQLDAGDVDMWVSKGVPSLNDEVLFGVVPTPLDYCNLFDLTGDCDLDINDFLLLVENWITQRGFLNESFETDVVADGSSLNIFAGDTLTDWDNNITTAGEYVSVINPLGTASLQPFDGDNYLQFSSFFDPVNDNIAQFEGGHEANGNSFHDIRIAPDTTYTVTVKAANPTGFDGAYRFQLVALDDFTPTLDILTLQVTTGTVIAGSDWSTVSISWDSSTDPSRVGDRLIFSMSGYDYAADDVIFIISGDYTQDGFINLEDFAVLASHWLDN